MSFLSLNAYFPQNSWQAKCDKCKWGGAIIVIPLEENPLLDSWILFTPAKSIVPGHGFLFCYCSFLRIVTYWQEGSFSFSQPEVMPLQVNLLIQWSLTILSKRGNFLWVWENPLTWDCKPGSVSSQYLTGTAAMTGGNYQGACPTTLTINASTSLP